VHTPRFPLVRQPLLGRFLIPLLPVLAPTCSFLYLNSVLALFRLPCFWHLVVVENHTPLECSLLIAMAFLNFSPRCFAEAAGCALALPAALVTFGNKLTEVAASQELELHRR
jgi:hypothetical protein